MIVAIDGPAASGKGTLAKRIAAHFGLPELDTGALYRAVARDITSRGLKLDDVWAAVTAARVLDPRTLNDPALRGREAGEAASVIAKIPEVRAALLKVQRDFASQPGGAVLDGRDIGTVICPDADVKIYVPPARRSAPAAAMPSSTPAGPPFPTRKCSTRSSSATSATVSAK